MYYNYEFLGGDTKLSELLAALVMGSYGIGGIVYHYYKKRKDVVNETSMKKIGELDNM